MKAAVVHDFHSPLRIEEVDKPTPGPDQIVVKIETSGLCHTDIHAARGDWPVKPILPLIPGHEGIGIVEMLGPGVTRVKEGDRVAIPWLGYACGHCRYCVSGWETLCESQINTGYFMNGAYAEYALAYGDYVTKVPHNINPIEAAPLACAGLTTYKAVKVKIAGGSVVAIDLLDEKLDLARRLGADYTVNAKTHDPVEEIKKLGGADVAIVVAVSPKAFEQAYRSLRRGGTIVFVALPADNFVQLPIFETVLNGIKIQGSIVGTRLDLQEVFDLHSAMKTHVICETRRLETVNEDFEDVEKGRVQARLVFEMD